MNQHTLPPPPNSTASGENERALSPHERAQAFLESIGITAPAESVKHKMVVKSEGLPVGRAPQGPKRRHKTEPYPAEVRQEAISMLNDGMHLRAVARRFGIDPATLRRWRKQSNGEGSRGGNRGISTRQEGGEEGGNRQPNEQDYWFVIRIPPPRGFWTRIREWIVSFVWRGRRARGL